MNGNDEGGNAARPGQKGGGVTPISDEGPRASEIKENWKKKKQVTRGHNIVAEGWEKVQSVQIG